MFERTLGAMPPDKARIIWQKYLEYELSNGDLSSIKKVEERLQKAYPNGIFFFLSSFLLLLFFFSLTLITICCRGLWDPRHH